MGVMACSKRGCRNILCEKSSLTHGYICSDCFEDLVKFCVNARDASDETIRSFMKTSKQNSIDWETPIRESLESEFR